MKFEGQQRTTKWSYFRHHFSQDIDILKIWFELKVESLVRFKILSLNWSDNLVAVHMKTLILIIEQKFVIATK